jgi:hypothetical protein
MKTKMSPVHADGWRLRKNKQPQKKTSSLVKEMLTKKNMILFN